MKTGWLYFVCLAVILSGLVTTQADASDLAATSRIKVHPNYSIEVAVRSGFGYPTAAAFAPTNSAFPPGIYVSRCARRRNQDDFIQRVPPQGEPVIFAKLPAESDPLDMDFPPRGSAFGDFLYVSANNRDGGRDGDHGGTIIRIGPTGAVEEFTPLGLQREDDPLGLGEPVGMVFSPDGSLIVANSHDRPCDIARVDASGNVSVYQNDGFFRKGFSPVDVAFGQSAYGTGLYFTDITACGVFKCGAEFSTSKPLALLPRLLRETKPRKVRARVSSLAFDPGSEFGGFLYVAVQTVIYRVMPDGEYRLFATGFEKIGNAGLKFSPYEDALYVTDVDGRTVYRISPRTDPEADQTVTISGTVSDQTGKPADRVFLSFLGAERVQTDRQGNYELSFAVPFDDEQVAANVLLADSLAPPRFGIALRNVPVESGGNVINFEVKRVPSQVVVGGTTFNYLDSNIRRFLNDDEDYRIGAYYGSDKPSYLYYGLGAVKHEYYFTNPGVESANMNLNYKNKSYAPVRIFKRNADGSQGETLGHLFIDQQGGIVSGEDARQTCYVLYLAMHAFGTLTTHRLDTELRFYKGLQNLIWDMAGNFDRMVQAGLALKGLETAISVYLDVTVSGDVAGAAMTTASSALFFKNIIERSKPVKANKPTTLEDGAKAVDIVKLGKTWYGGAKLLAKLDSLEKLKGADSAAAIAYLFPTWAALDPMELQKQLESMKLEAEDKKDILTLAYDTFQLVEKSDEHTEKAVSWKVQTAAVSAMVNEVIEVLEGVKNGIQNVPEAENIMTLKYTCSNISLIYANLLEDVINYNEFRKHYTISGNIYRGLRGSAERLGVVSEHSTEGARQLISAFKGDGTESNPGMAYYQMKGYFLDTELAAYQTKWTLERVAQKLPSTP